MPTSIPFVRIEKEHHSQLELTSPNNRWIILIAGLLFASPLLCMGGLFFVDQEIWLVGMTSIFFGLVVLALVLFLAPFKSQLNISVGMRMITLQRHYWLGETIREKTWTFSDITDVNIVSQGWKHIVEFKSHGKKMLVLNFGRKAQDAQRTHLVTQSWLKGLTPESVEAATALEEIAEEKQTQQVLKNAEKLLYYFGGFSLLGGLLGFFSEQTLTSTISTPTIINIGTGIIYLACGFGAKRKIEAALWVAIITVLVERAYWFIMSGTLSGEGEWSSWLTWIFAFFVVSSLWRAIQSIRAMEENPGYEPLA